MCIEKVEEGHNFLVEDKPKVIFGWASTMRMKVIITVLKVSELNKSDKELAYLEDLKKKIKY